MLANRKKAILTQVHMSNIKLNLETAPIIKKIIGYDDVSQGPNLMKETHMEIDQKVN